MVKILPSGMQRFQWKSCTRWGKNEKISSSTDGNTNAVLNIQEISADRCAQIKWNLRPPISLPTKIQLHDYMGNNKNCQIFTGLIGKRSEMIPRFGKLAKFQTQLSGQLHVDLACPPNSQPCYRACSSSMLICPASPQFPAPELLLPLQDLRGRVYVCSGGEADV